MATPHGCFNYRSDQEPALIAIATGISLLVHGVAAAALWNVTSHGPAIPPLGSLEVTLIPMLSVPLVMPVPTSQLTSVTPPVAIAKPLQQLVPSRGEVPDAEKEQQSLPPRETRATDAPVVAASTSGEIIELAAPADPPTNLVIEAPIFNAAYLNNPVPEYPRVARRLHLEGKVIVRVLVSPAGAAERVSIAESSGAQLLDKAALDAVREWTFVPAKQGSRTVVAEVDVPISFNLK